MLTAEQVPMVAQLKLEDGRTFVASARAIGATHDELRALQHNDVALDPARREVIVFCINEAMHRFCGMIPEGNA